MYQMFYLNFMTGANAQDCATPKLQTCATNFAAAAAAAGQDKTKICRLGGFNFTA